MLFNKAFHTKNIHTLRWENERVMSFVPPDGQFKLCAYHVNQGGNVSVPVYVKHNVQYQGSGGRLEVSVGGRHTQGKTVEEVRVTSKLPKQVTNVSLEPSQVGGFFYTFSKSKICLLNLNIEKINLNVR